MPATYSKWTVSGHQRTERDNTGSSVVVVITDPDRWEWHLALDRQGEVIDFRMLGFGKPIDEVALTHVPAADLARIARTYLARVQENWDEGNNLPTSLLLAELDGGDARRHLDGYPGDEEFARAWREMGPRTLTGVPRRKALAAQFSVSPSTIDAWLRRIRAAHPALIPAPTTGRGNRRQPAPARKDQA